jgi:hypothetical protein
VILDHPRRRRDVSGAVIWWVLPGGSAWRAIFCRRYWKYSGLTRRLETSRLMYWLGDALWVSFD